MRLELRLELREGLLAPDGYLHAGDPLLRLTPNLRVIL
jgi:hypothetical protein